MIRLWRGPSTVIYWRWLRGLRLAEDLVIGWGESMRFDWEWLDS